MFSELCRFYRNIMFSRAFSHLDILQVVNDGVYRTVSVYSCGKLQDVTFRSAGISCCRTCVQGGAFCHSFTP
jgi:hypothetical protein